MPQQLDISEEGQSNVSMVASSESTDSICQNTPVLKERNYMGLSDCSSVESSVTTSPSEKDATLNLKATELRLGLPGSQSPTRDREMCMLSPSKLDEKPLFPLAPLQKTVVPGNKRGFSDVMDGLSEENTPVFTDCKWMFPAAGLESETAQSVPQGKLSTIPGLSSRPSPNSTIKSVSIKDQTGATSAHVKEITPSKIPQEVMSSANNNGRAPPAKAQVVGWPPIRSFRKNTLTTTSKDNEEVEGKHGSGALFVKVSMDGAPYLRKVDLNLYSTYLELSSALEKMFSCFTIGQYGSHVAPGRDMLSESKLRDILHRSEYVLTYEDKDGDWMLVGDVPWQMFIDSCKRLHIMKSSDAIGLAPRATEKFRKQN